MMEDAHYAFDAAALAEWWRGETVEVEVDAASERAEAFAFFLRVLGNAVEGRPPLVEMGYRVWMMAARYAPGVCPHSERSDLLAMRRLGAECQAHLSLGTLSEEMSRDVFEFVLGSATTAERMGKRVSVLAYGINTSAAVRAALPSMEAIGNLWGLSAENKRSAVSAAAKKILREAREKMERRDARHRNVIAALWYAKRAVTIEKYQQAQIGNANRLGQHRDDGEMDEERVAARAAAAELRCGIPVKAEFARLTPEQLKHRLKRLADEWEAKRLAEI